VAKLETKIYDARISDLTETEHNPRQISKTDFDKLKKSLNDFPEMLEIREVVVDENGVILGGHQRVRAAKANGKSTITVKQVFGLTDKQKREFIIKDNIANGDWDLDEIANAWDDIPFDDWGADIKWEDEPEPVAPDEEPTEVDEKNEPKSERGKIYRLGNHFLMCGDSTSSVDVAELMNGQKADMVFTDPPYGMNAVSKSGVLRKTYKTDIMNDDDNSVAIKAFELCSDLFADSKQVWWGANYYTECLPSAECWIVWDKNNGESDQTDCELAWTNFRSVVRQFTLSSEKTNRVHPTQKPVKLIYDIFNKFDYRNEINTVVDLFGGSGSTLIACEQLGRKCYMMELDPHYCDVIRKRWVKLVNGNDDDWEELTPEVERG
jgi:DNA modification methylase